MDPGNLIPSNLVWRMASLGQIEQSVGPFQLSHKLPTIKLFSTDKIYAWGEKKKKNQKVRQILQGISLVTDINLEH